MARCKILQTFPLSVSAPPLQIINLIFEFVQKAKEEKKVTQNRFPFPILELRC